MPDDTLDLEAEATQPVFSLLLAHQGHTVCASAGALVLHEPVELDDDRMLAQEEVGHGDPPVVHDLGLREHGQPHEVQGVPQPGLTGRLGARVGEGEEGADELTAGVMPHQTDRSIQICPGDQATVQRRIGGDEGVHRTAHHPGLHDRHGRRHARCPKVQRICWHPRCARA